jgi:uncharacterized membrane protein SpoIIM required for sporulation
MKEIIFLKKYQDKWKELEVLLAQPGKKNPDKLSELFIQLTDDLSYSRTYYPDSNTTKYLNTLSAQLHQEIYRNKKETSGRFVSFWKYEIPLAIARNFNILQTAVVIFAVAFAIGWLSASNDDSFVRLILGDSYVSTTEENIAKGKPMDIYGSMDEGGMFLAITINNIYVSFLFFVLGITFGIGSVWKLISTGIMVGAFLCFFYQHDLLTDAMLAIWMHGTIEISVAIIAGTAGMVLGKGIAFPGTYSRVESMKRSAMDGLKIVIGLTPCFLLAGFIESFITRHYNYNVVLSASVIVLSLAFVISYFVAYPIYLSGRLKLKGDASQRENANNGMDDIVYGAFFLVIGLCVTAATFSSAAGGVTILFYGPVVYGSVRIIRGIGKNRKLKKVSAG